MCIFKNSVTFFALFMYLQSCAAHAEIPTSGTCNDEGTCLWKLDEAGTLTISAKEGAKEVSMDNYLCDGEVTCSSKAGNRPWEASIADIQNIVVGDNIVKLGDNAFQNAINLKTVTGMQDVRTLGESGVFAYAYNLTHVDMPNVTYMGFSAFYGAKNLSSVNMPNVASIGQGAFYGASKLTYVNMPDDVTLASGVFSSSGVPDCGKKDGTCINCGNKYIMPFVGCVADCGYGFTSYYGYCLRTRYTLPEADEATSDDNENMIEWIFE